MLKDSNAGGIGFGSCDMNSVSDGGSRELGHSFCWIFVFFSRNCEQNQIQQQQQDHHHHQQHHQDQQFQFQEIHQVN